MVLQSLCHQEELSHLEVTLISIIELCILKSKKHDDVASIILYIYIEIYYHLCYFLLINEFVEEGDLLSEK